MIASRVLCRGADTAIINGWKIEVTFNLHDRKILATNALWGLLPYSSK